VPKDQRCRCREERAAKIASGEIKPSILERIFGK